MRARRHPHASIVLAVCAAVALAVSGHSSASHADRVVIRTPNYPVFVVKGYGSIWVGAHHAQVVYRIDPRTNRVRKTVLLYHTPCGQPAVGNGMIFVPDCQDEGSDTLEVSAKSDRVVRILHAGIGVFAYNSYWGLSPDSRFVIRIDPRTGVVLARIRSGISMAGADYACVGAAGGGSVWFGADADETVSRIDAATNKIVAVIPLPGAAAQPSPAQGYAGGCPMLYAAGAVWRGNPRGVYRIDTTTDAAVRLNVKVGDLEAWGDMVIAAGAGSIWIRTAGNSVTRIDPRTSDVLGAYPATGGGGGLAVAYGSLWVANASADTTWRETLPG